MIFKFRSVMRTLYHNIFWTILYGIVIFSTSFCTSVFLSYVLHGQVMSIGIISFAVMSLMLFSVSFITSKKIVNRNARAIIIHKALGCSFYKILLDLVLTGLCFSLVFSVLGVVVFLLLFYGLLYKTLQASIIAVLYISIITSCTSFLQFPFLKSVQNNNQN